MKGEKIMQESDKKNEDWIVVYKTDQDYKAMSLKSNLESAGIEVSILSQSDHNFPAMGNLSVVKVLVKKKDEDAAREFINEINKESEDE